MPSAQSHSDIHKPRVCAPRSVPEVSSGSFYSCVIFDGNNSKLVRETLKKRTYWKELPVVSHSSGESSQSPSEVFTAFLAQNFNFCWKPTRTFNSADSHGRKITVNSLAPQGVGRNIVPSKRQLINHLPNAKGIISKTALYRTLLQYYKAHQLHIHDILPTTFLISNVNHSAAYISFSKHFREIQCGDWTHERMPSKHCRRNMWIVKPAGMNQGRGIEVFGGKLDPIRKFLMTKEKADDWIVQKYIERPLLYYGRKFDIRIWVLITDDLDVFVYKEGYIRTSSEKFTLDEVDRPLEMSTSSSSQQQKKQQQQMSLIHLTNFCMQKNGDNIGKYEDGNTVSYDQFQHFLDETFPETAISLQNNILPVVYDIIQDTALSVLDQLMHVSNPRHARHCFELFGYDFMLDEDFRPWLLEINTNPYLGKQNSWHEKLVEHMVEDMIKVSVDPFFPDPTKPVPTQSSSDSTTPVMDTGFELLFSKKDRSKISYAPLAGCTYRMDTNNQCWYRSERPANWLYPLGQPLHASKADLVPEKNGTSLLDESTKAKRRVMQRQQQLRAVQTVRQQREEAFRRRRLVSNVSESDSSVSNTEQDFNSMKTPSVQNIKRAVATIGESYNVDQNDGAAKIQSPKLQALEFLVQCINTPRYLSMLQDEEIIVSLWKAAIKEFKCGTRSGLDAPSQCLNHLLRLLLHTTEKASKLPNDSSQLVDITHSLVEIAMNIPQNLLSGAKMGSSVDTSVHQSNNDETHDISISLKFNVYLISLRLLNMLVKTVRHKKTQRNYLLAAGAHISGYLAVTSAPSTRMECSKLGFQILNSFTGTELQQMPSESSFATCHVPKNYASAVRTVLHTKPNSRAIPGNTAALPAIKNTSTRGNNTSTSKTERVNKTCDDTKDKTDKIR